MFAKLLTFLIYVPVRASAEINPLKRALAVAPLFKYSLNQCLTVLLYYHGTTRFQFVNVIAFQVEGSLQNRTFTGNNHNFIILIPKHRTYAPRVTHGKHFTASGNAAHDITAVKILHCGFQHIAHLYVVFNVAGHILVFQSLFLPFNKVALNLTVKPVPHKLKGYITVAVNPRRLPLLYKFIEYLVDIRHIEVPAQT